MRLHNDKFYIEVDGTEQGIATDLLEAGVPKEDIVLAFHHPAMRPYTEFAVA
ncbi:MAG: element excision factor XisI family protein [Caldilineaceae bacterium]